MDINCSLNCSHQKNGKCLLKEPKKSSFLFLEEPACPYYEKTAAATKSTR